MKNINKKTEFERQWEEVFSNAEMAPSDRVWDKIDVSLSKQEAGYFRKKAFYFRLLAAASIIFALGVGIFSINYYLNQDQSLRKLSERTYNSSVLGDGNSQNESATSSDNSQYSTTNQSHGDHKKQFENQKQIIFKDSRNQELVHSDQANNKSIVNSTNSDFQVIEANNEAGSTVDFVTLSEIKSLGIPVASEGDLASNLDHIYLIPIMPRGASKIKKDKGYGAILAGLDFSTGLFDPNFQQGNNTFASAGGTMFADASVESVNDQLVSFNTANKDFLLVRNTGQETKPQVAFSYGANVGFRLSRRIILQTGLAYRKANTTTTTTGYIESGENSSQIPIVAAYRYQLGGLSSVRRVSETSLNNQFEFASIPLKVGYLVLDRNVNLALTAGMSSEFFLNNRIGSENDNFETLSSSGSESPYKSIYFNGTLGTMLGYSFAENYLITIEPSYRFAVNSFTKNDFYLNSYPSSFMLSFGIAYNFK